MDKKLDALITFENLLKMIPAFFLFYGFIYLYAYADYFELSVSNIYDLDEIFLVFLPVVDVLLPLAILFILFWSILFFFSRLNGKRKLLYLRPKWFFVFIDKPLREKYKRIMKKKRVILLAFSRLAVNSTTIWVVSLVLIQNHIESQSEVDLMAVIFYGIIFGFLFFDFIRLYNRFFPLHTGVPKIPVKTFLMLICLLTFYGFTKNLAISAAQYSIEKKNFVSFIYEGARHTTNSDTICVLQSKKTFVLRSLKDSKNYFFEKDKISGIETRKTP